MKQADESMGLNTGGGKAWAASSAVALSKQTDHGNANWSCYCTLAKKALQDNAAIDAEDEKMRQLEKQVEAAQESGNEPRLHLLVRQFEDQKDRVGRMIEAAPYRHDVIQIHKAPQGSG